MRFLGVPALLACFSLLLHPVCAAEPLRAGFGEVDITPSLREGRPVWLAGYGTGREATGVHDPIMARCVVLEDGRRRIALVSVDLVGLQFPEVQRIRDAAPGMDYVLVSSTHNHEGPDVIGLWGRTLLQGGVDPRYLDRVVERVARMVVDAGRRTVPVRAAFGTAEDETLLHDSRLPLVKDGVLRLLRFDDAGRNRPAGLLVQWNCHPEALGSKNTQLTADFPASTVAALKQRFGCPVVYFTGAVGGLMAPPRDGIHDAQGRPLGEGQFEYARQYGRRVAELAERAEKNSVAIELTPLAVSARRTFVPVANPYYRAAQGLGVLRRQGYLWTGDPSKPGKKTRLDSGDEPTAVESEVAYLRLGDLHVAGIPGEIYPELVYGRVQEPADKGADFLEAAVEPSVREILPGKHWLLLGLANDELGYIIPRRQWDQLPPFAYDRNSAQYGEVNSCGPDVAPILMDALRQAVVQAAKPAR